MHAHELLARHREQAEGVVLAQVGLGGERQAAQIVEALDLLGGGPGGVEALARGGDAVQQARDDRAQALQLQPLQALARRGLDLRACARGRSNVVRGWPPAQG
jgi:hypothetical protein